MADLGHVDRHLFEEVSDYSLLTSAISALLKVTASQTRLIVKLAKGGVDGSDPEFLKLSESLDSAAEYVTKLGDLAGAKAERLNNLVKALTPDG